MGVWVFLGSVVVAVTCKAVTTKADIDTCVQVFVWASALVSTG